MDITITGTVGNDTEGLVVDSALSNALYPGMTDAQRANANAASIKLLLVLAYAMKTGVPIASAEAFVNSHTTETH